MFIVFSTTEYVAAGTKFRKTTVLLLFSRPAVHQSFLNDLSADAQYIAEKMARLNIFILIF